MSDSIKIRRALISVYDKTGIVDFARALHEEFGIEIISTGGTAKTLTDAGIPVTLVEGITGFPEMLDGRVKTLHPKIHAAILADRDNPEHMRQLKEQGIEPIDIVVVNLYPFEKTIAKPDCTFEEAIEMIDIGGPCLLRAAAKNEKHVVTVTDPEVYEITIRRLREGWLHSSEQDASASNTGYTFNDTSFYDAQIAKWLSEYAGFWPTHAPLWMSNWGPVRYGENPHQEAELLSTHEDGDHMNLVFADGVDEDDVQPKLSFNNYADASAALELCAELTRAGATGVWHRLPAGDPELWHRFSTGDLHRDKPVDDRVTDERLTRRNLPHIQKPEATYFVTFRLRSGELAPTERDITLSACRFWHGRRMTLHAVVVMPNHVHLLLTPHEIKPGRWVSLGELLHSIKRHSAREINRRVRGERGALWMDESFDRVVRNEAEFREKWEYMEANPVTAGLVTELPYTWFWCSEAGFMERVGEQEGEEGHRLETGATDEDGPEDHRSETGATGTAAGTGCACCFIKHTNACGVAVDADPIEAYRKAYLGDPNAAMGGVLAVSFNVDATFAEAVMETYQRWGKAAGAGGFFVEVWLAPSFHDEAVKVIRSRKKWGERVRLLDVGDMSVEPDPEEMDFKRIAGGVLMQTRDLAGLNEEQWKVVTTRPPTEAEMDDLRLAWLICKHTKSNAVTICKDGMLIGNGAGQMSRVMSGRIATWLARENGHEKQLKGAVAASDAFFPFRDGPQALIDAGVSALIQPGGSKRDEEVIAACDQRGVAMVMTGTRHFKH